MRDLMKNQRKIWYSLYKGKKPIFDENGDETGDYENSYDVPKQVDVTLSSGRGSAYASVFGVNVEYSRTLMVANVNLPINETSLVWCETKPVYKADGTVDENTADYEVSAPPAIGLDVLVLALKKRKKNG